MHVLSHGAVLIAAHDPYAFTQIIHADETEISTSGLEAFTGRNTASGVIVDRTGVAVVAVVLVVNTARN